MTAYMTIASHNRAGRHPALSVAVALVLGAAMIGMTVQAGTAPGGASIEGTNLPPRALGAMDGGSPKSDRLRPRSGTEIACEGQAWGRESGDCLVAIAKEGGKSSVVRIRTISGA